MYFEHMFGLLYQPKDEWGSIRGENYSMIDVYLKHIIFLAAIPAVALFIGTTQVGWTVAGSDYILLSVDTALPIAIVFYFAMLAAVGAMAYSVYWMEKTFGAEASFERCLTFTTFVATPMFLAGIIGVLPILWLDVFVMLAAVSYSVYLLYVGVPVFMNIPEDRGFIFSSSILTVGLCVMVGMMAVTVILWGMGMMPQYIV